MFYRGITLFSLPGKVYARVLERRVHPLVKPVASHKGRAGTLAAVALVFCSASFPLRSRSGCTSLAP